MISISAFGEKAPAIAATVYIPSTHKIITFRPKRSAKGPRNSVPIALPRKIAEIETETWLVVESKPSAIIGIAGTNISCAIGPNMANTPRSMSTLKIK